MEPMARLNLKPIIYFGSFVVITLIALFLVKSLDISYPVNIRSSNVSSELAVVGEGKVDVVPNSATVSVGISVVNAPTVETAQQQITETNNNVIKELSTVGIPKKQIKTSNYNINPTYQYDGDPEKVSGYSGNVTLDITVKDPNQLSNAIAAATKAGANQVFSTQMVVDEPEKYREQARTKAIENARAQAKELANELGIKLGKVVNIVESSPGQTPQIFYDKVVENRGGGAIAPDIQPGSQTITSTVTLYFEKR